MAKVPGVSIEQVKVEHVHSADTLKDMLKPHVVGVYLRVHHLWMQRRGVRKVAPLTRSTVWRGYFATDPALRSEFLVAAGLQR